MPTRSRELPAAPPPQPVRAAAARVGLREVQSFLMDRINNDLSSILLRMELIAAACDSQQAGEHLHVAQMAAQRIAAVLDDLSEESLARWMMRYPYLFEDGEPAR